MVGYCTFAQRPARSGCTIYPLTAGVTCEIRKGGSLMIILRSGDGKAEVVLNMLLPRGTFRVGSEYYFNMYDGNVYFIEHDLGSEPIEIFSLLHEIGHARIIGRMNWFARNLIPYIYGPASGMFTRCRHRVVQHERAAWAEALRLARWLRSAGIDLFPLAADAATLSRWIRDPALRSYENWLAEHLDDADPHLIRKRRKKFS